METPDLEDESAESFGVANPAQFRWKDIYDADACTLCARCQDRCPAWNTDKPLSPMKVINNIGDAVFSGGAEADLISAVGKDALWACTTCRACQDICPASIEHVNKIVDMRRSLVLMEGEFPGDEVQSAVEATEVNGNILGMAPADRGAWAEGLDVSNIKEVKNADVLYFAGCYAAYDKRNIKVARAFLKICAAAGVKVGIMGPDEKCCGEPARKLGNEYQYQTLAMENVEKINGYGIKKVVTTCPHCFNTLDRDYRDLGFEPEVEHYATFLDRLVKEGKLKLKEGETFSAVYHDSCFLGRYMDVYDQPRGAARSAGADLKEMEKNRENSFCCGGGGGRILAEEKLGTRINVSRVKMAEKTGASTLVSNCPFCLSMFEDGIKSADLEEKLKAKDLAELIADRLEG